jgi:hypothetical protein
VSDEKASEAYAPEPEKVEHYGVGGYSVSES